MVGLPSKLEYVIQSEIYAKISTLMDLDMNSNAFLSSHLLNEIHYG